MTKREMSDTIAQRTEIAGTLAKEIVQLVLDGIMQALLTEGRIELRNFGVFEVKKRKPRQARNPRTGEKVQVPAKLVVTFKPGQRMEERVGELRQVPGARL
jgi:integration host factor subunit beta